MCYTNIWGMAMNRNMCFNGSFYPNDKNEVLRYINHFNSVLDNAKVNFDFGFVPKAIISPHAGYVYSGFSANVAYRALSSLHPKRVIVIGPSHRVYLESVSIALYDKYPTPLGELEVDMEYSLQLKEQFKLLTFVPEAHKEHSTETQMPFIKHYFPNTKVIEMVYGKIKSDELSIIIDEIAKDKDNLIVISTDLSHFYTQQEANKLDNICLNAIANKNINMLDSGCEACGKIGIKAILKSAIKHNWNTKVLDYRTSFDASGDDTRVVGYTSCIIG
ncbi:MAG: AmmeMemoRadiSam system protein B [Campylobacterota bacterium]